MHSPAIGVRWQLWRRHRWWFVAGVAYFAEVFTLCHALPSGMAFVPFKFAMSLPLLAGLALLMAAFAYATDADVAGKESAFPARMFTLPMTTRALVGWPMLYGTVAIALGWLAVASLVLRPGGMNAPLWWPAVLAAGCLAWVQALAWRPFGLPGLRMVAAVVPIGVLVAISGLRWLAHLPEPVVALVLVSSILPAYVVAVAGVARARRGDQPDWQWLSAWARAVAGWFSLRGRSFGSPSQAQVWFEWRRGGLGLPIAVGLMIPFVVAFVLVNRHNPRHAPGSPFRSPFLLLVVPLLAPALLGGGWGNCGDPRSKLAIPAFLATRPMTCAGLIWAKMKAAAISAAIVWAMTLAALMLIVLLTGSWAELAGQWAALTKDFSALEKTAIVALGVVLLPIATWRPMIANMYVGLAGRNWVNVVAVFVMVLPPVA
ncbi:MAG TPA: hypothetical protein VMY37_09625, partial [Thermoguttaceae bacterium]|nr:hypothetical protein [Thermoguttaceae bacterium]